MPFDIIRPLLFGNLPPDRCQFDTARSAVVGAPYDGSIPTRGGSKDGPAAILLASQEMETYELELDDDPSRLGIATAGLIEVDVDGPAAMANNVERAIGGLLDAGKLPVLLGGEHSVTVGAVRAAADRFANLTVLQLDAHGDLRDSYQGSRMSHACVMRRVLDRCPAVQIGIRTLGDEERDLIRAGRASVVLHDQLRRDPMAIARALARLSGHVYITVDLDVLDPSIMSAVAFPEPGGLGWHETLAILRQAAERATIVGLDVVELAPNLGPPACAYVAAHLVYRLIGYTTLLGPGGAGDGSHR